MVFRIKNIVAFTKLIGIKRFIIPSLFCLLSLIFTNISYANSVSGIRVGAKSTDDIARVVFDLSEESRYKAFTLTQPNRLVIDIFDDAKVSGETNIEKKDFIKDIRSSNTDNGTRIVVEFDSPVFISRDFALKPSGNFGHRLVIDTKIGQSPAKTLDQLVSQAINIEEPVKPKTQEYPKANPKAANNYAPLKVAKPEKKVEYYPAPKYAKTKPKTEKSQKQIVVIDAGHGGVDPGALGVSGVFEKNITLSMAKQIRNILERSGKYKILLTRETDVFIPLYDRRMFAKKQNADLFISIHADSTRRSDARGFSIYTVSDKASDKEAEKLAERENRADIINGVDFGNNTKEVQDILLSLAQRETLNYSVQFADAVVDELKQDGSVKLLSSNAHKFAGFAVLKDPGVPSALVEMGFLSNREEEKLLKQSWYREKLASLIVRAIDYYFENRHIY
ncbi:MAG: N-acetylmuramoyl-L-alanine amidase [Alphaproteobacteria bacterium]|nr:N-acetylmuramoyl-L-alanine amidase [Alphaproteobacteria bacterium]